MTTLGMLAVKPSHWSFHAAAPTAESRARRAGLVRVTMVGEWLGESIGEKDG